MPPWSGLFLISWTGMRGIVTLAAALALPVTTSAGVPFPFRAEIILISFTVILATLVLQGLSLPPIIRLMHLKEDGGLEQEEAMAREHAATVALTRLDQVVTEKLGVAGASRAGAPAVSPTAGAAHQGQSGGGDDFEFDHRIRPAPAI
jgi:hypothetical protein